MGSKYVLGMGATTRVYGDFPIQSRKYIGNVSHIDIQMVFTAFCVAFCCLPREALLTINTVGMRTMMMMMMMVMRIDGGLSVFRWP